MRKLVGACLAALCFTMSGCVVLTNVHTHYYKESSRVGATCDAPERVLFSCVCGDEREEIVGEPLGHHYDEAAPSRIRVCTRTGCGRLLLPNEERKTDRTCTYTPQMKADADETYAAALALIGQAGEYVEGEHPYEENSSLHEIYEEFEELFVAYETALNEIAKQYQYAKIGYDVDSKNESAAALYNEVHAAYNALSSDYYALYSTIHASALRNYFYKGWEESKIQEILLQYGGYADGELLRLNNDNLALKMEYYQLQNKATDEAVPLLYARCVQNNGEIAQIMGYDDYMQYAYKETYGREYAYADARTFYEYVVEYLSPAYLRLYDRLSEKFANEPFTLSEKYEYNAVTTGSFFTDLFANRTVNDFLQTLTTKKGESDFSYAEKMSALFEKGDYYLGTYEGAYTWNIRGGPILYFGEKYQTPFTVVHEFGHYANTLFNGGKINSYDLLETHSQGLEMLYLAFLRGEMQPNAYDRAREVSVYNGLTTIMYSTSINKFEQSVYTGQYDGFNDETIMADGKITPDEYDILYRSILQDMGVESLLKNYYWRHVVIDRPCYYISYATSMACSLQFLVKAEKEGIDVAGDAYLKTVTFTAAHADWGYKEVLLGAGLYAYDDEELYAAIAEYIG